MRYLKTFEDLSLDYQLIDEFRNPYGANSTKVKELLKSGANPNCETTIASGQISNYTPLMFASYSNDSNSVKELLKADAEIDAQDSCGNTALMCAAESYKSLYTICLLIEKGANLYLKNNKDKTVFDILDKYSKRVVLEKFPTQCEDYILSKKSIKYNL
jgi:ankyrin repeat protein